MKRKKYIYFVFTLTLSILFIFIPNLFAAVTALSGVTLSPANPSPGDIVTVNWNYTSDYGPEPEKYFIAVFNQCAIPATGAGNSTQMNMVIGDACVAPTPAANCLSCVGASGCGDLPQPPAAGIHPASKTITMPSTLIPGYTYYAIVAMGSYNVYLNPDLTAPQQACVPFTCPLTAPYIKLNKVAEGTTGSVGQSVLFTIYYDAGNIHNFKITDAVDARFTITKVYNGGANLGQNITWTINAGYITSPQKGSVSFLAQINTGTTGMIIPNTAVGACAEIASQNSNTANVVIGQPGLSISKSASATTVNPMDMVTYFMQYINQGTTLVEYQNFDDGLIPAGWTNNPAGGTWNAAPGYLQQTVLGSGYTGYMDSAMTPIHDGIYICDMLVPSSNTAHMDGVMHFIQVDSNNFYMARINASDGKLYLDKVVATVSTIGGTSVANPHGIGLKQDVWYTVKVQVCGSSIMMKVWPRGDNEYPAWDLSVTDSDIPGMGIVGFQANEGPQMYDNLKVFSLTASTNPRIFDTVPAGISYLGCSGGTGCSKTGSVINWPVGSTCAGAQAVSWWGQVTAACGSAAITNQAGIDSDDPPPPVISNMAVINIRDCVPTPTPTYTCTKTITPTPSTSATLTQTYTRTPSPSSTQTPNNTATFTPSRTSTGTNTTTYTQTSVNTPTLTLTRTNTATNSPTFTVTASPTFSASATDIFTATPTPTMSPSRTNTQSPTFSPTKSYTATYSSTPTITLTDMPTYTFSPTCTFTVTDTLSSNTPTYTLTSTLSFTATRTQTPSSTASYTATFTASQTLSFTPTYTGTMTNSPTYTGTATYTATLTSTPSLTVTDTMSSNTPTYTKTATQSYTSTPTMTWTLSSTSTRTFTATGTPANTATAVNTHTASPTFVAPSATNTATVSYTYTALPSATNTFTTSPSRTPIPPTATITQTPLGAPVDMTIRITASGDDPAAGAIVKYTITIRNDGTGVTDNIKVWDTLPSNMTFLSSVTPDAPVVMGQYLLWNAGSQALLPGQQMVLTFTAVITDVSDGSLITTSVLADYNDPFYNDPSYKHPPIFSGYNYYPEGDVRVYPNPFNLKSGKTLKFINITPGSNVLIYTLSGESVGAIYAKGQKVEWDGKNRTGIECSAGIYYYLVVNQQTNKTRTGKIFAVDQ